MTSVEEARGVKVGGRLPTRGRILLIISGGVFWGWLFARWAFHNSLFDRIATSVGAPDLFQSEFGIRQRDPWFPAEPFQHLADIVGSLVQELGPVGFVLDWLRWLLELLAFATTAEPALASGAFITVYMTIIAMFLGLLLAVPLAVARSYGGPILRWISLGYTELIRGTPLLAQLFLLYYALPLAGIIDGFAITDWEGIPRAAIWVAVIGFTLNSAAYQSEYIRSALQSVDRGQIIAARSVGLSYIQGIRHIVLPQGLRFAIPGWSNEFVYLIKYSSLAAFITVPELFRQARNIGSDTFQFTDIYIIVALLYLGLVLTISFLMAHFEEYVALPGVGKAAQ